MENKGAPNKSIALIILACLIAGIAGAMIFEAFFSANKEKIAFEKTVSVPLTEISSYTLLQRMNANDNSFVIVDSRDKTAYDLGHIKGAISMPLSEIPSRYKELPEGKDIIVYCWSSECMLSPTASSKLAELGVKNLKELRIGWCEWSERGFPIEGKRYVLEGECFVPQRSFNNEEVEVIKIIDANYLEPCTADGTGC
ncbi:MAG: rhodanese-like domain-containing protein [archaeon]